MVYSEAYQKQLNDDLQKNETLDQSKNNENSRKLRVEGANSTIQIKSFRPPFGPRIKNSSGISDVQIKAEAGTSRLDRTDLIITPKPTDDMSKWVSLCRNQVGLRQTSMSWGHDLSIVDMSSSVWLSLRPSRSQIIKLI